MRVNLWCQKLERFMLLRLKVSANLISFNINTYLSVYTNVLADEEWYRAVILSEVDSKFKVYFVDFGNEEINNGKFVLNLSRELLLSCIPANAIKCNVKSSRYSDEDTAMKIQQAADGTYMLKVEAVHFDGHVYHLNIY